ncbi:MAG: Glycosyltransferase [Candidatus Yanofskybacteria bacterium GW2011_GWA1_44_21]|nr:MAG: Glycosyltransferase [Candidatus Wolfebacteria bacterium GW2011_GWB1_41_12]KKT28370.1 MAG: Glycosyltransferase [Candidatus Yanofskybacteria bacterium GW2011_GWA2_44_10]KKT50177.1 MAG: Glycosyltransferase [Candidatus Yanofskybacteria bacterium GW2011_GWA1_44_21]
MFSSNYLPHIGGAELALHEITKRIDGFDFDLITAHLDKSLPVFERIGNVNVFRIGNKGAFLKILMPKALFPLFAFIKSLRLSQNNSYGMVFALQASQAAGAAWLFKIFNNRIPFILNIQEGKNLKQQGKMINFFRNLIIIKADAIITISDYLKEYAKNINLKARISVIPNGVDFAAFSILRNNDLRQKLGYGDNHKVVISVSRLVPKNGLKDLIESLVYLEDDVKLLIIGDGPLRDSLKLKSHELGLDGRIKFAGQVTHDDLPKYLAAADVFVRPSLSEGLGTAFLEAMAAKLPVVGTKTGGITDFIINRETGLFCEVNNSKDIADKVDMILKDNTLKDFMVSNARKLINEKYDWEIISRKYKELFQTYGV